MHNFYKLLQLIFLWNMYSYLDISPVYILRYLTIQNTHIYFYVMLCTSMLFNLFGMCQVFMVLYFLRSGFEKHKFAIEYNCKFVFFNASVLCRLEHVIFSLPCSKVIFSGERRNSCNVKSHIRSSPVKTLTRLIRDPA